MNKKVCRVSEKIGKMLVDQMGKEMYNHNLYLSMAGYFGLTAVGDLETYYRKRAHEEYNHFMWIFDYLVDCDYDFVVPAVEGLKEQVSSVNDIFSTTVEAEIQTSSDIETIYEAAMEEKDYHTKTWLEEKLIKEQREEETTSRTALEIMLTDGPIHVLAAEVLSLLD